MVSFFNYVKEAWELQQEMSYLGYRSFNLYEAIFFNEFASHLLHAYI